MGRHSLREDILDAGLELMFREGYQAATVRDICAAAGNLKEAAGAKVEKICHAAEQKAAECSSAKHDSLKEDLR